MYINKYNIAVEILKILISELGEGVNYCFSLK